MKDLRKISENKLTLEVGNNSVDYEKDYGRSDLNWEDSADKAVSPVEDPSMNDYLKGYNMEPYQFQQWAQKNILYRVKQGDSLGSIAVTANTTTSDLYKLNGFSRETVSTDKHLKVDSYVIVDRRDLTESEKTKFAAKEVQDITYTPENLAKEIVTLWSQVDGPLQNFFDGFMVNKTDNKMKSEVAQILNSWGYDIKPTYTQDTPIFAAYKAVRKIAATKDAETILDYFKKVFPDSYAVQLLNGEVKDLVEHQAMKVTIAEAAGLADYYKQIFPGDYAIELVSEVFDKPNVDFKDFKDIQISDESLEQMEKMDSENQDIVVDPTFNAYNGGQGSRDFGYDYSTQMRSDFGFPAGNYEINSKVNPRGLKKK